MTAIFNRGAMGPSQAVRLSQGHTDSSSGRSPAEFWHLPESAGTQALLPEDLALALGGPGAGTQPAPTGPQSPFHGPAPHPTGKARQNR